jgi:hypothetical protein
MKGGSPMTTEPDAKHSRTAFPDRRLGLAAAGAAGALAVAHLVVNVAGAVDDGLQVGLAVIGWIALPSLLAVGFAAVAIELVRPANRLPRGLLIGTAWLAVAIMTTLAALVTIQIVRQGVSPRALLYSFAGPAPYCLVGAPLFAALAWRSWAPSAR